LSGKIKKYLLNMRGKRDLVIIIAIALVISAISILSYIFSYGFEKIIIQLIRFVLLATLSYFLYIEKRWAKWVWLALMGTAGMFYIIASVQFFMVEILGFAIIFMLVGIFCLGSSVYIAFYRKRFDVESKKKLKKIRKSFWNIFWKIYFWFFVIMMALSYPILLFDSSWFIADFIISIPGFIAFYGYVYKKIIFPRILLWKIYAILFIVWGVIFELLLYPSYHGLSVGEVVFGIVISGIAYIGVILYAFWFLKNSMNEV